MGAGNGRPVRRGTRRRPRTRQFALVAVLIAFAALLTGCRLRPADPAFITDEQGRAIMLRGVNVSNDAKGDPLHVGWVTEADIQRLAGWGFNTARHLVFWEAVEPQQGVIDEAYLDRVEERLDWYADAGIMVILDMHQDVYGRAFGSAGAPEWATYTDGLPFTPQTPWWLNYAQPAVLRAFDHFWDAFGQHPELQDEYEAAWMALVERFHDHPAVLGYEFMNEPFIGGTWALSIGEFEAEALVPFYQRLIDAVRDVDEESWIFVEPMVLTPILGLDSALGSLDDPRDGDDRLVYAPHFYQQDVHDGGAYNGDPSVIDGWGDARVPQLDAWGWPMLLGEWGVYPSLSGATDYADDVLAMTDRLSAGWTWWSYDIGGGFALLNADRSETPMVDTLVRPYPQRVAGDPGPVVYDPATKGFAILWAEAAGVAGPTEIFVPADRHYPDGFSVRSTDPDGAWSYTWDPGRQVVSVEADPSQALHLVVVEPAPAGAGT